MQVGIGGSSGQSIEQEEQDGTPGIDIMQSHGIYHPTVIELW